MFRYFIHVKCINYTYCVWFFSFHFHVIIIWNTLLFESFSVSIIYIPSPADTLWQIGSCLLQAGLYLTTISGLRALIYVFVCICVSKSMVFCYFLRSFLGIVNAILLLSCQDIGIYFLVYSCQLIHICGYINSFLAWTGPPGITCLIAFSPLPHIPQLLIVFFVIICFWRFLIRSYDLVLQYKLISFLISSNFLHHC